MQDRVGKGGVGDLRHDDAVRREEAVQIGDRYRRAAPHVHGEVARGIVDIQEDVRRQQLARVDSPGVLDHVVSVDRFLIGQAQTTGIRTDHEPLARRIGDAAVDSRRARAAQGVVGLPHAVRPRPAGRAADADVAQPLRHQQPQGRRPGRDAAAERDSSASTPAARSASCSNAAVRDPALLVWLDAPANRKGHPNENLARELMELFTLGIGHYTEADVKEAARALTGWTRRGRRVPRDRRPARRRREDHPRPARAAGRGDDLVRHAPGAPGDGASGWPARLCELFLGEGAVDADGRRRPGGRACASTTSTSAGRSGRSCARGRSSPTANLGTRVLGPVEFVVGAVAGAGAVRPAAEHAGAGRLGRRGWARTCSTRRTSAAGPAAGPGSRRAA